MKKKIHVILAVMIFMSITAGCGSSQPTQTAKQEKTTANVENKSKPADTPKASAATPTTEAKPSETVADSAVSTPSEPGKYEQISQEKAKEIIDAEEPD